MQIWTADLVHSTGKCRYRPSISDCLRRPFLHFQFGPDGYSRFWYAVAIFGHFFLTGLNIQRERRKGEEKRGVVMLFYATRSLILSIMLAGRISVQAINEKAPAIDHVGPWFVLQLLRLLSLRLPKPQTKPQTIEG